MAIKTPNKKDQIDEKIEEWWKEMGAGLWDVITWACTTLHNTLSAWVHIIWAWISKLQESLWDDKDQKLKESRKNITNAHMKKAKNKWEKALKSAWKTIWWWLKTVKGTWKVAIHSFRKTVKSIKNSDNEK